jgi:hypothetical protein
MTIFPPQFEADRVVQRLTQFNQKKKTDGGVKIKKICAEGWESNPPRPTGSQRSIRLVVLFKPRVMISLSGMDLLKQPD